MAFPQTAMEWAAIPRERRADYRRARILIAVNTHRWPSPDLDQEWVQQQRDHEARRYRKRTGPDPGQGRRQREANARKEAERRARLEATARANGIDLAETPYPDWDELRRRVSARWVAKVSGVGLTGTSSELHLGVLRYIGPPLDDEPETLLDVPIPTVGTRHF